MRRAQWGALTALALGVGCRASNNAGGSVSDSEESAKAATPVTIATVQARTIDVVVSGTGGLDVLDDERVRAPFNGILTSLTVHVGDRVAQGEAVGSMIAENSDAALRGARSMVASARTEAERVTAREALRVAEANIVHTPLVAAQAGVVIAGPASAGERLTQGDSVISVATTSNMVFFADIAQSDLALVHSGQRARIKIAARSTWLPGVVHNIMPADTASTATMRVRINLTPSAIAIPVGAFGTAVIVVNQRVNVPAVPKAALMRDDITGKTSVALVLAGNIAHWIDVVPGIADSSWVEIRSPMLTVGQRIITSGHVGLPDSTRVVAARGPDTAGASGASTRP